MKTGLECSRFDMEAWTRWCGGWLLYGDRVDVDGGGADPNGGGTKLDVDPVLKVRSLESIW
jgi:hypothetical protein